VFDRILGPIQRTFDSGYKLLFSRIGIAALSFTLLYILVSLFVPSVYLVELGNALVFAFALVNLCLYLPDAVWATKNDNGEAGQYFVVGLSLILIYLVELRAYSTIWRWLDYPASWSTHPFHAFFLYIAFFGLTMLMTAPGMTAGRIPIKNWKSVAAGVSFAVFVLGVTVGLIFSGQPTPIVVPERGDFVDAVCPTDAPIKGNINKGKYIYHIPGSDYFQMTKPVICFRSEESAIANGFRAPKARQQIEAPVIKP